MAITSIATRKPKGSNYLHLLQVTNEHDEDLGKHPVTYTFAWKYTFADIPACTATGGAAGGAGATVLFPALPANCIVKDVMHRTPTAFVNSGGTQEIDGVLVSTDTWMADGDITAGAGLTLHGAGAPGHPLVYATPAVPLIYFAGAAAVTYTSGVGILLIEVLMTE